jgi:hypothetical protein
MAVTFSISLGEEGVLATSSPGSSLLSQIRLLDLVNTW